MSLKESTDTSYSPYIEKLNYVTHGLGALIVLLISPVMVVKAIGLDDRNILLSVICFLIASFLMFSCSTLYHKASGVEKKTFWKRADHMSIYSMIAGSYTPFMVIYLWDDGIGATMLCLMWSLTFMGVIFKVYFTGRFKLLSTAIYVLMGLSVIGISDVFFPLLSSAVKHYLIAGGVFYLIGVGFYLMESWKYHHPVWHLFVIGGAFCHAWAVWLALGQ